MDSRQFRAAVRRFNRGKSPNGFRYPLSLREQALSYVRARRKESAPWSVIGRELGIRPWILSRWDRESSRSRFQKVEVIEEDRSSRETLGSSAVILTTPGGIRVEGLDMDSLAILLRRLG